MDLANRKRLPGSRVHNAMRRCQHQIRLDQRTTAQAAPVGSGNIDPPNPAPRFRLLLCQHRIRTDFCCVYNGVRQQN
jgi:hypothetical protein